MVKAKVLAQEKIGPTGGFGPRMGPPTTQPSGDAEYNYVLYTEE